MQNKKQDVKCEWKYISYTEQGNRIVDVVRTSFKPACHIKRVNKTLYMKRQIRREQKLCDVRRSF